MRRALLGAAAIAALAGLGWPAAADPFNPCPEGGNGTAECPYIDDTLPDGDGGSGGDLVAGFIIVALLVGGGTTLYKVTAAKDMARRAGLNEHDAAVATVLSEDGLAATYVASSLRSAATTSP